MTLAQLLKEVEVRTVYGPDPAEVEISSLSHDSRRVGPGCLFAALKGVAADGHDFAEAAKNAGVAAMLLDHPVPAAAGPTQVVVGDTRHALARAAHEFHGRPSRELTLLGITGTNGKTTMSYLVEAMLAADDPRTGVGVIGTVDVRYIGQSTPAAMTTPESLEICELLAAMRDAGVGRVVMEASSHGLAQHRVSGLAFDLAMFTNLSRDHLDYHPDMDSYFAAKASLFLDLLPASVRQGKQPAAVVCIDDSWGAKLHRRLQAADQRSITYGLGSDAQVTGRTDQADLAGTRCRVSWKAGQGLAPGALIVKTALVGRHNLQNLTGAVAAGLALGMEPQTIASGLEALAGVPGRVERVDADEDQPAVFVDYAHTDGALAGVLSTLKPLTPGRLICVFGAGGDRDQGKRPLMGRAVGLGADLAVLTSDNPRTEDPLEIMAMIEPGLNEAGAKETGDLAAAKGGAYVKEPDRAAAIAMAIDAATPDDVILIAGKGHEDYQIIGTTKRHFDDREQAAAALSGEPPAAQGGEHA